MEASVGISRQIAGLQNQLRSGNTTKQGYRGSLIEGSAVKTYASQMNFQGKPIVDPGNINRMITDKNGKLIGFSRKLIDGKAMASSGKSISEIEAATRAARQMNEQKPGGTGEIYHVGPKSGQRTEAQKNKDAGINPITAISLDSMPDKERIKPAYAHGFIPNFAPKLNAKALKDAAEAEISQGGPGTIPKLGFHKGDPSKPFIYNAKNQTETSAPMDHGGYNKGTKESQSRRGSYGKNMVANMAYSPKNSSSSHSPVFNISFNPQNSVTYADGFVPNFANQKGLDYESMIANIKKDMEKRWQETVSTIGPMQNTIKSSQRDGILPYNKPKSPNGSISIS
jgi:hypothetical protein